MKAKTFRHTLNRKVELVLATGNANHDFAQAVADYLSTDLADVTVSRFSDGESRIQIRENMREKDMFIIQPLCAPVNEHLMDLLIMVDAMKRASVRRICAVIPYYGYARQDKKMQSREPITARLVADLLEKAGVDRVMTMDLHAHSIQGFFSIPVDHLSSIQTVVKHLEDRNLGGDDTVIVSPDVGGVVRARTIQEKLHCTLAIINKRRPKPNVAEVAELVGSVEGKRCIMIDDIIDTAGTLAKGAEMLLEVGKAKEVIAFCTHGVLSGPAFDRIKDSCLKELIVTDTIPLPKGIELPSNIKVVSVADVFGEAISRNFEQRSISELFI